MKMSLRRQKFSGVVCEGHLPLKPVLKSWIEVNKRFARAWHGVDVPWRFNERAQLGLLAAAIWRAGEVSLEEFTSKKIDRFPKASATKYAGRIDLYLNIQGFNFIAESKLAQAILNDCEPRANEKLHAAMERAEHDARKMPAESRSRLAIVFVVPLISTRLKNNLDRAIRNWIEKLREYQSDAVAWVFPSLTRHVKTGRKYYCPGVAVVIRQIW